MSQPVRMVAVIDSSNKGGPLPAYASPTPQAGAFYAGLAAGKRGVPAGQKLGVRLYQSYLAGVRRAKKEPGIVAADDVRGQVARGTTKAARFRY